MPVGGNDEVGRLGSAFNGMLGALAASRDDQRRLVEDAGHELRTPLTSVRTNLAVLRRHPDLDPETRAKIIDDLHAETEELVGLVEEVVSLARGSTDGTAPEPVELGAMASVVARRAERRHSRPVTVVADDSIVEAAPPALERAISNLVDNAAKFDAGNGAIEIEIAAGRLIVLDRGPGITAADAGRVFDRFYRADDARALPGSGLGLSIVREVVERAGGHVEAAPRPGGGAIVGFTLPLVMPPDDSEDTDGGCRGPVGGGSGMEATDRLRSPRRRRDGRHITRSGDRRWNRLLSSVRVVTPAPHFEVFVNGDGVCIARGELDEHTSGDLASVLAAHPAVTSLDLGEVSFIDSAGLRALLVARGLRQEAGTGLHVCRSSTSVRRVMRLAGITHLFAYEPGSTAAG